MKVDTLFFGISGLTWLRLIYRSDDTLKLIAEKTTTSDRLMEMIPTGGQTEAVRPGYDLHFGLTEDGLTRYRGLNFTPLR